MEIRRRQAKNKTVAVIATVPGCGAYSSLALAARIGSIERFPRPSSHQTLGLVRSTMRLVFPRTIARSRSWSRGERVEVLT